jgi:hypothetical protein
LTLEKVNTEKDIDHNTTIQSINRKIILRYFESTAIEKELAENIVNFCIDLRRRVVEGYITRRPRKAGNIFHYVYQWAKKESKKLEKLSHLIRRLDEHVYEEIFIAPY